MSSPRQNTFLSRSISSNNASRIASRYVTSDIVRPPARGTLVYLYRRLDSLSEPKRRDHWRVGVDPDERISRVRHWRRFGFISRAVDLVFHASVNGRKLGFLYALHQ